MSRQEGQKFEVSKKGASLSVLIQTMTEDGGASSSSCILLAVHTVVTESVYDCCASDDDEEVPLMDVSAPILKKIVEYMERYAEAKPPEIEKPLRSSNMAQVVPEWDASFIDVEQDTLFKLILGANYMDIKPLLDLACAKVASMIKGKTPEEIRKTFNIENDFTPEEEAQVRDENRWAEET